MKKSKIVSTILLLVLALSTVFTFACTEPEKLLLKTEKTVIEVNFGDTVTLPKVEVYDGNDKIVTDKVPSVKVSDPSGETVEIADTSFKATKEGEYKAVYSLKNAPDLTIVFKCSKKTLASILLGITEDYKLKFNAEATVNYDLYRNGTKIEEDVYNGFSVLDSLTRDNDLNNVFKLVGSKENYASVSSNEVTVRYDFETPAKNLELRNSILTFDCEEGKTYTLYVEDKAVGKVESGDDIGDILKTITVFGTYNLYIETDADEYKASPKSVPAIFVNESNTSYGSFEYVEGAVVETIGEVEGVKDVLKITTDSAKDSKAVLKFPTPAFCSNVKNTDRIIVNFDMLLVEGGAQKPTFAWNDSSVSECVCTWHSDARFKCTLGVWQNYTYYIATTQAEWRDGITFATDQTAGYFYVANIKYITEEVETSFGKVVQPRHFGADGSETMPIIEKTTAEIDGATYPAVLLNNYYSMFRIMGVNRTAGFVVNHDVEEEYVKISFKMKGVYTDAASENGAVFTTKLSLFPVSGGTMGNLLKASFTVSKDEFTEYTLFVKNEGEIGFYLKQDWNSVGGYIIADVKAVGADSDMPEVPEITDFAVSTAGIATFTQAEGLLYRLIKNGAEIGSITSGADIFAHIEEGENKFAVRSYVSVSAGSFPATLVGKTSAVVTITKLKAVSDLDFTKADGAFTITFTQADDVTYILKIAENPEIAEEVTSGTDVTRFLVSGVNTLTLIARKDGFVDSDASNPIEVLTTTRLDAVTDFALKNGIVTFTETDGNTYTLYVGDNAFGAVSNGQDISSRLAMLDIYGNLEISVVTDAKGNSIASEKSNTETYFCKNSKFGEINPVSGVTGYGMNDGNVAQVSTVNSVVAGGKTYNNVLKIVGTGRQGVIIKLDSGFNKADQNNVNFYILSATVYFPAEAPLSYFGWIYPVTGKSAAINANRVNNVDIEAGSVANIYFRVSAANIQEGKEDMVYFTLFQNPQREMYILDLQWSAEGYDTSWGLIVNSDQQLRKSWLMNGSLENVDGELKKVYNFSHTPLYRTSIGTQSMAHLFVNEIDKLKADNYTGTVKFTVRLKATAGFIVSLGRSSAGININAGYVTVTGTGEWQDVTLTVDMSVYTAGAGQNGLFLWQGVLPAVAVPADDSSIGTVSIANITVEKA